MRTPVNFVTKTVNHTTGKKAGTSEEVNVSQDVHEDYEQTMFRNDTGGAVKTKLTAAVDGLTTARVLPRTALNTVTSSTEPQLPHSRQRPTHLAVT